MQSHFCLHYTLEEKNISDAKLMNIIKNKETYFLYVLVIIFFAFLFSAMWDTAVETSEDKSSRMQVFSLATKWLSDNLGEREKAIISFHHIYWSLDPSLKQKTIAFDIFWEKTEIFPNKATDEEIGQVRHDLKKYIQKNNEIKYLVFDWFDPKSFSLIDGLSCNQFEPSLKEVKKFTFIEPNSRFSKSLIICEIVT